MKKTIIVTGGAGFIGSCIVARLNQYGLDKILIVDKLRENGKQKNLQNKKYTDFINKEDFIGKVRSKPNYFQDIDTIFHMGACSSTLNLDEKYLKKNNTDYSIKLAKWCMEKNVKYIYASSGATYGDGSQGFSDDLESLERLNPLNPYGKSKHDFDLWVKKNRFFDSILGIKFFNVFGPNEYHKGEMRSVIHKAFPGVKEKGVMRLFKSYKPGYADGEQKRDFIYIKDVLEVMIFFYENKKLAGLFNVGKGQADTWNDVARSMFKALNKPVNIEFIDMPDELRPRYQYFTEADITQLRDAGYKKEFTSIEESVKDYICNYLDTEDPYY
ncbi:MAG: ADP-glyceromanno-heptose 6-epimerase [Candidatus Aureabacteria bacterium]|nr:ADP-glyceromanno-heptose 6-epimerase [Candidatus Auribacterota bacterium]